MEQLLVGLHGGGYRRPDRGSLPHAKSTFDILSLSFGETFEIVD
jgi:hypothetical protein